MAVNITDTILLFRCCSIEMKLKIRAKSLIPRMLVELMRMKMRRLRVLRRPQYKFHKFCITVNKKRTMTVLVR
jgi:hypothetical protein